MFLHLRNESHPIWLCYMIFYAAYYWIGVRVMLALYSEFGIIPSSSDFCKNPSVLGFWLGGGDGLITYPIFLLIIGLSRFSVSSWCSLGRFLDMLLRIYSFLLGCTICWHIVVQMPFLLLCLIYSCASLDPQVIMHLVNKIMYASNSHSSANHSGYPGPPPPTICLIL